MNNIRIILASCLLYFVPITADQAESQPISPIFEIRHAPTLSSVDNAFKNKELTKDSLVIFDIDNTLLTMDRTIKPQLVNKSTPALLTMLAQRGIKAVCLTSVDMGGICAVRRKRKIVTRPAELKFVGLNFEQFFSEGNDQPIVFGDNPNVGFYRGIIFADNESKGTVLAMFLSKMNIHPRNVFFVDDSFNHLLTVLDELFHQNIPFVGLHYTEATPEYSPIHLEAIFGNTTAIKKRLESNSPINTASTSGETPLHCAAKFGHLEIVKILLEHGADAGLKNKENQTAIDLAKAAGNHEIANQLSIDQSCWPGPSYPC